MSQRPQPFRDDAPLEPTDVASTQRLRSLRSHLLRHEGVDHPIARDGFLIGRAADCDLRLGCGLASRHHARFRYRPDGELTIEDLGSRNGVLVNAKKVNGSKRLRHADVITVGLSTIELIDQRMVAHPGHLSTLPPAPPVTTPLPFTTPFDPIRIPGPIHETLNATLDVLSEREREVLQLIVLGHTPREMAEKLHISVKTIDTHRTHLMDKLSCRSRAELVTYAITAGLLKAK
jgi:DNA-binding CsgD family transcriptional regulator